MQERRNNDRMLCAQLVELVYRDSAGVRRRRIVNLDDISRAGACIQSDVAISEGTDVRLHCGSDEFEGTVRYCGFRDGSYFLGLEFAGNTHWCREEFEPEHLLNPKELVEKAMRRCWN
jgi:hypothetical protein